ncbi:hypothetical protein ACIBJI_23800 [Nocardia sp. NPDC050408]|uniref:hypothetical protein n=1 Tax=Nocardia sp. NPDC050408 TaxID=3364319 RepID=UPI0037B3CF81
MTDDSRTCGLSNGWSRPGKISTALFGPELYAGSSDLPDRLQADVDRIPELRQEWGPDLAHRLYDPECPVGTYDTPIRGLVLAENSAEAHADRIVVADPVGLATDAPARLGVGSTHEPVFTVFNQFFEVPPTDFWRGVAEQLYGFGWCLVDQTRLCPQCVHGAGVSCVFGAPFDYHHFVRELSGIAEDSRRAMVTYIDHARQHGPRSPECAVMDCWLACLQALYLDVLHPKAVNITVGNNELRSLRYRILNSAGRPLALLTALERPGGVISDQLIEATGFAAMVMHDACDRRHDNAANESYNFFTLLAAHNQAECVMPVHRFCIDLWAWAIDHQTLWPILLSGRMLVWNVYMTRYQTATLLDYLLPPGADTTGPYADPILNRMNPAPRAASPDNYSIRHTCQDKAAYDRLLDSCLAHFVDCTGCRGYEKASWQERTTHLDAGYRSKAAGNCTCVDRMAVYTILALLDPVWWAADPTARYTGPTAEWNPYLV